MVVEEERSEALGTVVIRRKVSARRRPGRRGSLTLAVIRESPLLFDFVGLPPEQREERLRCGRAKLIFVGKRGSGFLGATSISRFTVLHLVST